MMIDHDLSEALHFLQSRHFILLSYGCTVRIWAAGRHVPRRIRTTIGRYRYEVMAMIARNEQLVCPSPVLHRRYVSRFLDYAVCDMCSHLRSWVADLDRRTKSTKKSQARNIPCLFKLIDGRTDTCK